VTVRVLAAVTVVALLVVAASWVFQDRLIYLPSGRVGAPADVGLPGAEEVVLTTSDGLSLGAWLVPAGADTVGTVIVFPGNAGNRSLRAPLAAALSDAGLDVLLVDYRGFGGNPGRPSEGGLRRDARAALAFAQGLASPVVFFGESIGAAVAADLAADHPPAALVLRSPFTSLADVGRQHYRWLPVGLLLRDRFDVIDAVSRVETPVLVVAGDADSIVPTAQSRQVAGAAGGRLTLVPGADHNDLSLLAGDELVAAVVRFLRDAGVPAR